MFENLRGVFDGREFFAQSGVKPKTDAPATAPVDVCVEENRKQAERLYTRPSTTNNAPLTVTPEQWQRELAEQAKKLGI